MELRIPLRILDHFRRAMATESARISLGPEAWWFRAGDGPPVDLRRRDSLRRILLRLVRHRMTGEAGALTVEELIAAGWPEERILPQAGLARIYTAIKTLRSLGLRDLIHTRGRGYELDRGVRVQIEDTPPEELR
jgi:hypothetical protein